MPSNQFNKPNKMNKILGFLLYIVAFALYLPLTILNIIVVIYKYFRKNNALEILNNYFYDEAYSLDVFANRSFRTLWNTMLRKKGGYSFGERNETISSALGKNQRDNTLSFLGEGLCKILDTLDKDHCQKSIDAHFDRVDKSEI